MGVRGPQINTVLATVMRLSSEGDEQLAILLFALVVGMKSMGVTLDIAQSLMDDAWATPIILSKSDFMDTVDLTKGAH